MSVFEYSHENKMYCTGMSALNMAEGKKKACGMPSVVTMTGCSDTQL